MRKSVLFALLLLVVSYAPLQAQGSDARVRAVLFWAEGCPHCHTVIDKVLPPLQTRYGAKLAIQMIEISSEADQRYFLQIEEQYKVPSRLRGVPALFVGDRLLVGPDEIAAELPKLIDQHLASGGLDYPNLPGLAAYLPADATSTACTSATPCTDGSLAQLKYSIALPAVAGATLAPTAQVANNGFGLAWVVTAFMILALLYVVVGSVQLNRGAAWPLLPGWADNLIPMFALLGLAVALYLTYVETQQVAAVCGPVGDCNAVQTSPYARLFGVLPVGLLGAFGYVAILMAWLVNRFGGEEVSALASLASLGMALFGVLFSLYLTYLELFVIQAVCIWCITSAVVITALMVLGLAPALAPPQEDPDTLALRDGEAG